MSAPFERDAATQALYRKAERLRRDGDIAAAIEGYRAVLVRAPRHAAAHHRLGVLLHQRGETGAALKTLREGLERAPQHAAMTATLGALLKRDGQHDAALLTLNRALQLDPDDLVALFNKAELLLRMNHPAAALLLFDRILAGTDDRENIRALSRWLRAVAVLTLGDYHAAWPDYESRCEHPTSTLPLFAGERWRGQALHGKRIFLAWEQRYGDVIQFVRFVPRLLERGAQVIVQVPGELLRLFSGMGANLAVLELTESLPAYDYWQYLTSIAAVLDVARDAVWTGPYLAGAPVAAGQLPGTDRRARIGLVWAGKPEPDRSISLEALRPLLQRQDVAWFSFQLGARRGDLEVLPNDCVVTDLSASLDDFYATASLMKHMDLIVTVDTAAAHLGGALGLPTWVLLVHYSDWRWGQYSECNTPWYPTARLFRQPLPGAWKGVVEAVSQALSQWLAQRSPGEGPR